MKTLARFSMATACAAVMVSSATWVACSDSGTATDGGTDGTTGNDSGGGTDTGTPDTGMGGDAGTDTGGGMDGGSDGAIALNCNAYCTSIMQVCTAGNAQYLDMATCTAMCGKLTVGDAGAMTGNTLACRAYHLSVAAQMGMAAMHCPHAGPYGFGGCGSECENFCALYAAQCGNWGGNCANGCPNLANPDGGFLNGTGNTLDCREYHLENAYQAGNTNGMGHCAHAANNGGGICQ